MGLLDARLSALRSYGLIPPKRTMNKQPAHGLTKLGVQVAVWLAQRGHLGEPVTVGKGASSSKSKEAKMDSKERERKAVRRQIRQAASHG